MNERDGIDQKKLQGLRREIQIGIDQAERGQVSAFNKQTLEEITAEGRERLAVERRPKSR